MKNYCIISASFAIDVWWVFPREFFCASFELVLGSMGHFGKHEELLELELVLEIANKALEEILV